MLRRSRRWTLPAAALLVAVVCAGPAASAEADPATASIASAATPPALRAEVPLGAPAAGRRLHLDFLVSPRDPAALAAASLAVNTQGSPTYHHFLPAGRFAATYGASPATIAGLRAYLRSVGLTPGPTADGVAVPVTATVAAADAALHVGLATYRLPSGRRVFANTRAPSGVPLTVASSVVGVTGLSDLPAAAPDDMVRAATFRPARSLGVPSAIAAAAPTACSSAVSTAAGTGGWTATELSKAYGITGLYADGLTGSGQTVGLLELEPYSDADIAAYQHCYGTDSTVSTVDIDGGATGPAAGSGESALDIDTVIGSAPGAAVAVYSAPDSSSGLIDAYAEMATSDTAKVLSTSWGLCEQDANSAFLEEESTYFEQMAVQGQDLMASSGDDGSSDCLVTSQSGAVSQTGLAVNDPASQPDVTGVGGTSLATIGPDTERVWNDSYGAGGGGLSTQWAMPSYQAGPGVINPESDYAPCEAETGAPVDCREVPDVSADADPQYGYVVEWDRGWGVIGGTSAAAPEWAGLLADIDQSCTVGFANPALYQAAASPDGVPAFTDITAGNNDFGGFNGGTDYDATTGYDLASGLGSPIATGLLAHLCDRIAPPSAAPAAPAVQGLSPSSGPATGSTITVTGTGFAPGATVQLTSGTATVAATGVSVVSSTELTAQVPHAPAGVYTVTVTTSSGTSTPSSATYDALAAPAVTHLAPASGPTSGATTLVIAGTGFAPGARVVLAPGSGSLAGDVAATSVTVVSATGLTARTPAVSRAGTWSVYVITGGGVSNGATYTYVAPRRPSHHTAARRDRTAARRDRRT